MIRSLRRRRRSKRDFTSAEQERVTADTSTTADTHHGSPVTDVVAALARWSLRLLLIAAAAIGALYLLGHLWVVVLPSLLALLLSTVLWPAARGLRRVLPDSVAAGVALIGGLVGLVGLGAAMGALVVAEADELSDAVVEGLEEVQDWTTGPPLDLGDEELGGLIGRGTDEL